MSIFDRSDEKEYNEDPLSCCSTADLITELCRREGVESHGISESYRVSIVHEIECLDPVEVYGPARIIVVQGVE